MSPRDDDSKSNRQIERGKMRRAGDRSARLATALMKLPAPTLKKLQIDLELRDAIDRARRITSLIARRRAERTLAGDLRRYELAPIEEQLQKLIDGNADAQQFHLAEQWRTRLIADGIKAAESFPGGADPELPRLIDAAQRERDTGRPPGAARALFRWVVEALKAQQAPPAGDDDDDDELDDDELDDE